MKGCRPLTENEVDLLVKSFAGKFAKRDKALFLLGTKSGFRISELLSLRVGDVVQHGHMVNQVTVKRRNMKKKIEGRSVILHPDAKAAIADWLNTIEYGNDTFIFRSRKAENRPISRRQALRIFRGIYDANELSGKLGTHTLRKTFADRIYEKSDRDLAKTQRALGHKNINSTISYLDFKQEDIDTLILGI